MLLNVIPLKKGDHRKRPVVNPLI